jgi:hypothetical protein
VEWILTVIVLSNGAPERRIEMPPLPDKAWCERVGSQIVAEHLVAGEWREDSNVAWTCRPRTKEIPS